MCSLLTVAASKALNKADSLKTHKTKGKVNIKDLKSHEKAFSEQLRLKRLKCSKELLFNTFYDTQRLGDCGFATFE